MKPDEVRLASDAIAGGCSPGSMESETLDFTRDPHTATNRAPCANAW